MSYFYFLENKDVKKTIVLKKQKQQLIFKIEQNNSVAILGSASSFLVKALHQGRRSARAAAWLSLP